MLSYSLDSLQLYAKDRPGESNVVARSMVGRKGLDDLGNARTYFASATNIMRLHPLEIYDIFFLRLNFGINIELQRDLCGIFWTEVFPVT